MNVTIMKHFALGVLLCFGGMLAGCNSENEPDVIAPNERVDIALDQNTRSAADNLKEFYVNFTTDAVGYVDADDDMRTGNVAVSPLSASMVLAMVANGVSGETQREITEYLGVPKILTA